MFRYAMMLSLLAGSVAVAQTEQKASEVAGPSAVFGPRDVFSLSQASDVQISPDGKHIAYTRATGDIMIDGDRKEIG